MEIKEDIDGLLERISTASKQIKKAKSSEERIALGNYLYNMYESLVITTYLPIEVTEKAVFGSHKDLQKFSKKAYIDMDRVLQNFFDNRSYHRWMLGNIINNTSEPLNECVDNRYGCNEQLSKGEFFEIFSDFLKELHLGKEFDKFIKNVGIYAYDGELKEDCGAYMLHNPLTNEADVFVGDFYYNVNTMSTLAHEFGHVYDFSKYKGDLHDYNKFLHQSFYLEVMSKLFERLLVEYLINNNILVDDAKDEMLSEKYNGYTTIIASYIGSLLDYDILKKRRQDKYSDEYIYSLIKDNFDESIIDLLKEIPTLDIRDNYIYTYGNIISMIMKENVNKYGFSNDMIYEMFDRRGEIFSPEFLIKYNVNPDSYTEGYQKELKLLQK